VTFGTSYRIDFPIASNFKSTGGTPLPTMLNNINCVGGTNSASAYWMGYQALIANPEAGVLNVILFFTDGQPNTVHVGDLRLNLGITTCNDVTPRNGVIAPASNGTNVLGVYRSDPTGAPPVTSDQRVITNSTNCQFASNATKVTTEFLSLTPVGAVNEIDVFGNLLTGYKPLLRDGNNRIRINDNGTITNAGINALDSAAKRARDDANGRGLDLLTFAVGLSNNLGAAEDELMNRVANTPISTAYQGNRLAGLYVRADNVSQLDEAFASLASDIMRFSK
jgi:hypothetical protein